MRRGGTLGSSVTVTDAGLRVVRGAGPDRLVGELPSSGRSVRLAEHRRDYPDPTSTTPGRLWEVIQKSGVLGRGGAGFPSARKLAAVAERGGHVVVVNATEGEPASAKDRFLLTSLPHLVLDGAELAALATGAREIVVCVDAQNTAALEVTAAALAARSRAGGWPIGLAATPPRYVTGEETALVNFLNGGPAVPVSSPFRPFERGVDGRPTLVHNAETLAQLALAHRHGPSWYRSCGSPTEPGTTLVTMNAGEPGDERVLEVELGTPGRSLLEAAGTTLEPEAVLVGGYFGTWVRPSDFAQAAYSREGLARHGASPGAGIVALLPRGRCGLTETARVLAWYARESAGQCGPCAYGLPALARSTIELAAGRAGPAEVARVRRWSAEIAGRGACRHPDGAVRLLASALEVFGEDVARHAATGPCAGAAGPGVLPVPVGAEARR